MFFKVIDQALMSGGPGIERILISGEHVDGPGFSLSERGKSEHTYPVDGWHFFNDHAAAHAALGVAPPTPPKGPPNEP